MFAEVGFVEYLQAVDFLQLNDMVDAVSKLISHKEITNDNVFDVLELTQSMKAPVLQTGCLKCIKENINELISRQTKERILRYPMQLFNAVQ